MEIQRYVGIDQSFDSSCLEEIILRLGKCYLYFLCLPTYIHGVEISHCEIGAKLLTTDFSTNAFSCILLTLHKLYPFVTPLIIMFPITRRHIRHTHCLGSRCRYPNRCLRRSGWIHWQLCWWQARGRCWRKSK